MKAETLLINPGARVCDPFVRGNLTFITIYLITYYEH